MNFLAWESSKKSSSVQSFLRKQFYLIKAELLSLRLSWQWSLLIVLVAPLSMLMFLYLLVGQHNPAYMTYAITGNIIMSLVTGTMLTLGQELGLLKQIRGFDYYASLPLHKLQLIIAYLVRATVTTLPSILILIGVGGLLFKVELSIHWSLFLIVLLAGMSLSGLGVIIGVYSRNASQASTITQVLQPLIVYCAPVFIPVESMPTILRAISYFIPTSYVANAVRASLNGLVDGKSILILLAFCIVSIYLVEFKIDWRQK